MQGPGFRVEAEVSRVLSTSVTPELDPAMTVRLPEGQSRCVIYRLRRSQVSGPLTDFVK